MARGKDGKGGQSCGAGRDETAAALAAVEEFFKAYAEAVNQAGRRSYRDYCILDDHERSVARKFTTLAVVWSQAGA
jgi:hypothetical protein